MTKEVELTISSGREKRKIEVALDLSEESLQLLNHRAAQRGVSIDVVVADLVEAAARSSQ